MGPIRERNERPTPVAQENKRTMEIDLTAPQSGAPADLIKDTSTETFQADVLEASTETPVIVDFWAPWCGPCKQLTPVLEKAVREARGAVKLVKLNIDENPALAQRMRVQSIPAVFAFVNGRPVDGFMGAQPESQVKAFVQRLTGATGPSPEDQLLEHAKAAFEAGDIATSAQAFGQLFQADPSNVAALAGLAKCYLKNNDVAGAEQLLQAVPPDTNDPELDSARAALELAQASQDAGDTAPLLAKIEANPKDHQARIDLAVSLNARGDREGAVAQLLESIRIDRNWNDEEARKQLLKLFEAYGPMDEITLSGRRQLSSLLFS